MNVVGQIVQGVELKPEAEEVVAAAELDLATGFLQVRPEHHEGLGQAAFLGFGISGWQHGTAEITERFQPVNDITALDPAMITVSRQGKGIGARMYNTPQAVDGSAEHPDQVGMYQFSVDTIRDYTRIPMRLAVKHAFLVAVSQLLGTERAMFINDSRQGETSALLYGQTIDGHRQRQQSNARPSAVPERFMVIRDPNVVFELAGLYEKSAAS